MPRPRQSEIYPRTAAAAGLATLLLLAPAGPAYAQGKAETGARPTFQDNRRWTPKPEPALTNPPPGAAAQGPAGAVPKLTPPDTASSAPGTCGLPIAQSAALEAGRMRITLASSCRGGQDIVWTYGGGEFDAKLDAAGRLEWIVDAFAGTTTPVGITFADKTVLSLPMAALDLDKVSKIAVIWRTPVDLDLNVFEYAAMAGQTGHISAAAPSSLASARDWIDKSARGHGYLSTTSVATARDRLEVYTFLHKDGQGFGFVTTSLDYATRGERPAATHCGAGDAAEVPFRTVTWSRHGQIVREAGVIAAADCGRDLSQNARLNPAALPTIRIRN